MRLRHWALRLPVCWVLALAIAMGLGQAAAQGREALKQPNKTSLYERVLTRPGASLLQQPGDTAGGQLIDAFSRYYVYGRQEDGERSWLEVGVDAQGEVRGWVDEAQTVPWRQQLAVAFTNPAANRERTLFFADWASLEALMAAEDPGSEVRPLTQRIMDGETDERVVAIEPDRHIDINERFYLLPILGYEELFSDAGHLMRGLKVASVTKTELPDSAESSAESSADATTETAVRKLMPFRASVVFVIDSTISMQQYIDEARQAVKQVYERIEDSDLLDRVAFGLVAFRAESADPTRAKQLEYVARLFVDPSQVTTAEDFLSKAADLREASVTTDRFDEDPYAGVQLALDEIPWP